MSERNEYIEELFRLGVRVREDGSLYSISQIKPPSTRVRAGYKVLTWGKPGTSRVREVALHRLAAYQWFGEVVFQSGVQVRHLDGNPLNNSRSNLSYGNQSDNKLDIPKPERVRIARVAARNLRLLTSSEVASLRRDRANGMKYKDLMTKYRIGSKSVVSYIVNKKTYSED